MEAVATDKGRTSSSLPAAGAAERLTVSVLGPLRVLRGTTEILASELGGPKPRQILEILVLRLGTPVSKQALMNLLWEDRRPAEALATLESYVSVLRRRLQPGAGKFGALRTTTGGYVMDASMVDLDLDRFTSLLRRSRGQSAQLAFDSLSEALDLADLPLLDGEFGAGWAEAERERHGSDVVTARIMAAEAALTLSRPEDAVALAERAVRGDPLSERGWTALIVGLENAGRPAEALRAYENCRQSMDRELGCTPGPRANAAYHRLLRATAGGDEELSEALSALLVLHEMSKSSPHGPVSVTDSSGLAAISRQAAGDVLHSFLRRAMAVA
jgi:DNA-binding SARP family transcriptional activator